MNDIRTVSFTYTELAKIKVALGYALTNPYNPPETERVLYSARDKVTEALKAAHEAINAARGKERENA